MSDSLGLIEPQEHGTAQYLTFLLGDEVYGVDILRVQEIKGWKKVTHLPNTPDYLCGVLNVCGTIIPVVDLRLRFGMPAHAFTPETMMVVLKVNDTRERMVAIVVDDVADAHNVMLEEVKPVPDFGRLINTDFISGLVLIDDSMVILLNIDRLLRVEALG
tara:strand:- start:23599 stop:24078 length:480 start_codon:yes stop_codon:yes gene_type:complete